MTTARTTTPARARDDLVGRLILAIAALGRMEPADWLEQTRLVRYLALLVAEHEAAVAAEPAPEPRPAREPAWSMLAAYGRRRFGR